MSLTFQSLTNPLHNNLMQHNPAFKLGKLGSGLNPRFFGGAASIDTRFAPGTPWLYQNANYNQPAHLIKGPRALYSVSFAPQGMTPMIPDLGIAFQPLRQDFSYI